MVSTEEKVTTLKVVKRNGKKGRSPHPLRNNKRLKIIYC